MADRDENVFQAKLAEQAERYDGEFRFFWQLFEFEALSLVIL